MTTEELKEQFHEMTEKMNAIMASKNHDYAGDDDPWGNLASAEPQDICTNEVAFLVRMNDKWSRLKRFVKVGILKVKDETVTDTLLDFASYLVLMAVYLRWKRKGE